MKRKHNGGYSLIEVLIAMAVLGIITVPTTSALLTAHRMNVKAEQMLEAQLEVSSAVESLMATGIASGTDYSNIETSFNVKVDPPERVIEGGVQQPYYKVVVTSEDDDSVTVTTYIRETPKPPASPENPKNGGSTNEET